MRLDENDAPEDREICLIDLRRRNDDLELNKRRKLQYALGSSIAGSIIIAIVTVAILFAGGDFTNWIFLWWLLPIPFYYIMRSFYALAVTPWSITRAAFLDRDYWRKFFSNKAPDDPESGEEGNNIAEKCRQEGENSSCERPRHGDMILGVVLAIATLYFSIFIVAPKLVLIGHYGWTKVQQEHLHFLAMPLKGHLPYSVSNGEKLDVSFTHFVVSLICWFLLFIPLDASLRLLLPKTNRRE